MLFLTSSRIVLKQVEGRILLLDGQMLALQTEASELDSWHCRRQEHPPPPFVCTVTSSSILRPALVLSCVLVGARAQETDLVAPCATK